MIGELNIGHAYVGGGDYPKPERIPTGLLGAKIDQRSSVRLLPDYQDPQRPELGKGLRSPLTEIGVDAKEGDFIVAVNGNPSQRDYRISIESSLEHADKQVTLTLNARPQDAGSRRCCYVPTGNEQPLYYYNWVQRNIEKVDKATGGRVGYLHIPDMGVPGLNEFVKYYYPQARKEAMIIDVRGNGGGNVSPISSNGFGVRSP